MIIEPGRLYQDSNGDTWRAVRPNMFRAELMWCHCSTLNRDALFFLSGLGYTTEAEGRHLVKDATDSVAAVALNDW